MNRSLHPDHYNEPMMTEIVKVFDVLRSKIYGITYHHHRRWEYASAIKVLSELDVRSVLDIGGGGSLFAPLLALCGFEVTTLDSVGTVTHAVTQAGAIGLPIQVVQADFLTWDSSSQFDATVAVSTIEHVEDHFAFVRRMGDLARKLVFLTTDFSSDGRQFVPHHLRTYSPEMLRQLAAELPDFKLYGEPEWVDHGPHVADYNFASLCLKRV